jgi:outer membrane protein assembly factor BamD (BamD/ComL family)
VKRLAPIALAGLLLAGCSTIGGGPPRVRDLDRRQVAVETGGAIEGSRDKAIEAYRDFVRNAVNDPMRPEAMRRLADLEMERAEARAAEIAESGKATADPYAQAAKLYEQWLAQPSATSGRDRVLYQLAKAYESRGDTARSVKTMEELVARYPDSPYRVEAQFRLGEQRFIARDYAGAQRAYADVVAVGPDTPYFEQALYKHGWTHFKQANYEAGLESFLNLLDRRLASGAPAASLDELKDLTRAERELIEDTLRVVSLSFSYLDGPKSIAAHLKTDTSRGYAHLVYVALGEHYLKTERIRDAADTFVAYADAQPLDARAPQLHLRAIDAYQQGKFATLVIEGKKEFIRRYGPGSAFRKAQDDAAYAPVAEKVRTNLVELARHYHAGAQKEHKPADFEEAARWYGAFLADFPRDPQAAGINFLYAELRFEQGQFVEAARAYERTAYDYPAHPKSAEAGYAALLAYTEAQKRKPDDGIARAQLAASLRFADKFPDDARAPAVLTRTAEELYARHSPIEADQVAKRVLARKPPADATLRRTATTVVAHVAFDTGAFDRAEKAYGELLGFEGLTPEARAKTRERLAASVYKQGEQARSTGDLAAAVRHFERVGDLVPESPIRITATYDAAAALITQKQWKPAIAVLERFRATWPTHALVTEVSAKLAVAYLESGDTMRAAQEFNRIADTRTDPAERRAVRWQAATLFEQARRPAEAFAAYERYVREFPDPVEPAVEARAKMVALAQTQGDGATATRLQKEIVAADRAAGKGRTDRTRLLAAQASLTLAEPLDADYRKARLVEPLKKTLKIKKAKLEAALKAYENAAGYQIAEVTTAATFRTGELYRELAQALMQSQRPKGLKGDELEQYNVLLEEQAFPFEEKAIEIHEVNAHRTRDGIYDDGVKKSFAALAKLKPVRYGKTEQREVALDLIH